MKKMVKDLKKHCINSHRLKYDRREQLGLEYLSKYTGGLGYSSQLLLIKDAILCMDKGNPNYQILSPSKKKMVKKLIEDEEVVNIVLCTLFQWFGTAVGRDDIGILLSDINSINHEGNKREITGGAK